MNNLEKKERQKQFRKRTFFGQNIPEGCVSALRGMQKHGSLLRCIELVITSKLSTNSQMILKPLYFYLENASLFIMGFPCLTIAYQELCLFSKRVNMPAKNRLLFCLMKIN